MEFLRPKINLKAYSIIFKYFLKQCDEIKDQVYKTLPREKSPYDEIKSHGGLLKDIF
jgi:hypothetical protein